MVQLLSYHQKVFHFFKQQQKTWDFFAADKVKEEQLEAYKNELLKNTYKFDASSDSLLFELLDKAKEKLGLSDLLIQIYQAQHTDEINASIIYFHKEAHIVFSGSIKQLMNEEELLAILAHELAHVKLYTMLDGQVEITDRIITAIANNYNSEPAYYETARLFKLYTEIYCDRGAYEVLEKTAPVITSLIKAATGLSEVSAESYVRQAEEIFSVDSQTRANSFSHPENFIRARAIHLWHAQKEEAEEEISRMIEGWSDIDQLDIFKQEELSRLTREFLELYLKPKWFQSPLILSHATQFFADFNGNPDVILEMEFRERVEEAHASVQDYLCYLMLDFAMLDAGLEEIPFGWAYQLSEDLAIKDAFDNIVKKELKLSNKRLQQHKQGALAAFQSIKEGEGEQVYEG